MTMAGRWWSDEEDAMLMHLKGTQSASEIGSRLGRSKQSVLQRIKRLKAGHRYRSYTAEEEALIRYLYGVKPVGEIAKMLGRTRAAVARKIRYMGLTATKPVRSGVKRIEELPDVARSVTTLPPLGAGYGPRIVHRIGVRDAV